MKINTVEDLLKVKLPIEVVRDINQRIGDWLAAGGNIDDPYIKQQFSYAEKVSELKS